MNNLSNFKQFLAVADFGNFHRAAQSLGISYSALSQTITKMELQYRTPLLTKKYRSIALTEAGRCLLSAARSMVRDLEVAEGRIEEIANGQYIGTLNIGVDPTISNRNLTRYVAEMMSSYPKANISVRQTKWSEMEDALLSRQIDLYVGPMPDITSGDLIFSRITFTPAVFLCRPGHELLNGDKNWMQISHEFPIVSPSLPHNIWKAISSGISSLDFANWLANVKFVVVEQSTLVRDMVLASDCIGLIFGRSVDCVTDSTCELARMDFSLFDECFTVACLKRDSKQPTMMRFFAIAAQV